MTCGNNLYKNAFELPQVNSGGLNHALSVHSGGDQKKGMFFQGTEDETIFGYAQKAISQAYESGKLHENDVNTRVAVDEDMGQEVGFSRDTGESTRVVRCAFDLKASSATLASVFPI